ncbi:tRNA pseudouridine(38-40) synthase TruA [Candidatus Berkiella cookevillensis]|uniref:tRNA pseudouridine synthase A n=1 Tax=Candidatus Berkiella cookevillensis TaxID=437022 RepID=A0A0Q9YS31_9GAMM|nr:tRNA pseudouridine(38-40) synthase TruA [Candidatus Berkiella cookevillensis]MCS5708911.1 tRNA pseudouridine(38-40) synthase TruA [Candidatus Berkiella cookevillensis]
MTERIALGVAYDGTRYHGYQCQPDKITIQSELEAALFKMTGVATNAVPAGRTDKGVHALNQVVHFDTEKERSEYVWLNGLNAHLPSDIKVQWVQKVASDFHARFSAFERHYRYLILNKKVSSPIFQNYLAWYPFALDVQKMQEAALSLIGQHDFSAFRGSHCQAHTPIRTMNQITLLQKNNIIQLDIKANAFLHHMVRNIVGTLVVIGANKQPPVWMKEVLESLDRKQAGMTAPAHGLYFFDVRYDSGALGSSANLSQQADSEFVSDITSIFDAH